MPIYQGVQAVELTMLTQESLTVQKSRIKVPDFQLNDSIPDVSLCPGRVPSDEYPNENIGCRRVQITSIEAKEA